MANPLPPKSISWQAVTDGQDAKQKLNKQEKLWRRRLKSARIPNSSKQNALYLVYCYDDIYIELKNFNILNLNKFIFDWRNKDGFFTLEYELEEYDGQVRYNYSDLEYVPILIEHREARPQYHTLYEWDGFDFIFKETTYNPNLKFRSLWDVD